MLLEQYLIAMRAIHATGANVAETSFYPPLSELFNAIGKKLKPKVHCVMQLSNQGAGMPDGGLFTQDQYNRDTNLPKESAMPSRGVVEAKGLKESVDFTKDSKQVAKYWDKYKLVLVTNFREFLLIGENGGKPVELERYTLAETEAEFWQLTQHPQMAERQFGEAFTDYLSRIMLYAAPLSDPKDLAWFLASYAREARHRIEHAKKSEQLTALKQSLEAALGISFTDEKGEHFFRSTLTQTLFYGLFAAWVLRHRQNKLGEFDWRTAAYDLHVPMISALFEQLAQPTKLRALNLEEVLDWTATALNRVDKQAFFSRFQAEHSVQYFYEPFLQAFDPELRKQLGVWYTPEEIVRYQVARVDSVLQTELGLADGLADPNVIVLDPCCGTGAYLVEVMKLITKRLKEQGGDALIAQELKRAAIKRLFGFELLPAPYVIAHLQIGLLLHDMGAPLVEEERAGIYLTNALTGWEPVKEPKASLPFAEFAQERDAADAVKQSQKILVILGNPPYNAFAGVAQGEEKDLVKPYKEGLSEKWGIKKYNLDDLYIRFFRLAERRIAEQGGRGVVSYISNYSYLTEPSYVVMRERLLENFDQLWFDNLNGDSRETGKVTPEGKPDPSVFSTAYNREGIQQGTAIALLIKGSKKDTQVHYQEFWGATKREDIVASLDDAQFDSHYTVANPAEQNRNTFRPSKVSVKYQLWPSLAELCEAPPNNGLMEKRGGALIDIDREALANRMQQYFDKTVTWQTLQTLDTGLTKEAAGFEPKKARDKVIKVEGFDGKRLLRYAIRPFETRWCYYTPVNPLWNRPRPSLWAQYQHKNQFLISRLRTNKADEGLPFYSSSLLSDDHLLAPDASCFAFWLYEEPDANSPNHSLFGAPEITVRANLSTNARHYLDSLGFPDPDVDRDTAALIWYHALAIGYSPSYLAENADGVRQDWPRIPLPMSADLLRASATLGREIAALLDTETPVAGVTTGKIRTELSTIAVVSRAGGGALKTDDMQLTAGWGHSGKDNATMPGRGKIEARNADDSELEVSLRYKQEDLSTLDVYMNDVAYWKNIPESVWKYKIGGYQVIKKWLSYREYNLLQRAMTLDEVREVSNTAKRIAALVLMRNQLDENYKKTFEAVYPWNEVKV